MRYSQPRRPWLAATGEADAAPRGVTRCAAQLHHIIRNFRETVNQRDPRGLTALHRAAFLAQYDGYLQIYEYLLVRRRRPRALQPLAFCADVAAASPRRAERGR